MDLFIYLRNGQVAPITGCTAIASVDASTTPSAGDLKLLTQNSGTYRDVFSSTFESATTASLQTPYALTPDVITLFNGSVAGDDVAHTAPRLLTWQEALWAFTCTVDTETLTMHFLKKDVIGWGNVQPDV